MTSPLLPAALMAQSSRPGRIIAIASGKGGVGKTWFAITLAHALAQQGERTLLFDGDLGLANVDIQLGLLPARDLSAVLYGSETLETAATHHAGGFDILAGRSGSGDLATLDAVHQHQLQQVLATAQRRYSTIVVDLGAGLDPFVRQMAVRADLLLVIATDDPTSLTDAYAVLKLHQRDAASPGIAPQVVINQATSKSAGERTYATLARACERFLGLTPRLAGVVRRDERVRDAIRRQTLLMIRHPVTNAAEDVREVARGLLPASSSAPGRHSHL